MAGPLLFLGAIVINARLPAPPDSNKQFGPDAHRELLKYVEPVRAAQALNAIPPEERAKVLDKVTALWISRTREQGSLETVLAPEFLSMSQDSVLTDIKFARMTVVMSLHDRAGRFAVSKDFALEARTQVSVFQIASIDKYSDFPSINQFANLQVKALNRICELAPQLSDADKHAIWSEIAEVDVNASSVREVAMHLRRIHADYLAKKNDSALISRVSQSYHALATAAEDTTPESVQTLRVASVNSGDDEFVKIGSMGRLAVVAEKSYRNALARTKLALQSVR